MGKPTCSAHLNGYSFRVSAGKSQVDRIVTLLYHEAMSNVIQRDPDILSGMPSFQGTRVPIKNLFDYLSSGSSIDEFLDDFPSVSKQQVLALLDELKNEAIKDRDAA